MSEPGVTETGKPAETKPVARQKPAVSLAAALVAAWGEMEPVAKDAENPHFKSKFTSLDKLIEKTRPTLKKHGLALVQFPAVSELGAPILRTIVVHAGSGEQLEADMPLLVAGQSMQQLGSAITYARRYAWAAALGIAAEADDDGNTAADAPQEPKYISNAQRKRLFAIATERGIEQAALRDIIYGVTQDKTGTTTTIRADQYDKIVAIVEAEDVPF